MWSTLFDWRHMVHSDLLTPSASSTISPTVLSSVPRGAISHPRFSYSGRNLLLRACLCHTILPLVTIWASILIYLLIFATSPCILGLISATCPFLAFPQDLSGGHLHLPGMRSPSIAATWRHLVTPSELLVIFTSLRPRDPPAT